MRAFAEWRHVTVTERCAPVGETEPALAIKRLCGNSVVTGSIGALLGAVRRKN